MTTADWLTFWKTPWETRYAVKYGRKGISSNDGDVCISFITKDFLQKKKNPICLDIGADDCWWSIFCCQHFPTTQVDAFEPNKRPTEWVDSMRKDYPGIRLYNKAISNTVGTIPFTAAGPDSHSRCDSSQKVECITLDFLLNLYESVDLIKIDTEGHEVAVLTNIAPYASKIGGIIFECSVYWYGDTKEKAVSRIFDLLRLYKHSFPFFYFVSRRGPPILTNVSDLEPLYSLLEDCFDNKGQFDMFMTKEEFSFQTKFPPHESIQ